MTGASYEDLDRMVRDYALGSHTVRLKIWNSEGQVVYSTLESQVGESYPDNEHLQQSLQGRTVWEVAEESESPEERGVGDLMEIYAPLAWEAGAKPAGALEVYLDYAPYARLLTSIRNAIFGAVVLVGASVILATFVLYRTGYRTVQRQRDIALQRQREVEGLNRLLQRDIADALNLRDEVLKLKEESDQLMPPPPAAYAWLARGIQEIAAMASNLFRRPEEAQAKEEE